MNNDHCWGIVACCLLESFCLLGAVAAGPSKYTSPGSCSSPSCHGGVQQRSETTVLQNEDSAWVVRDKHARVFANLTNPVGMRMTKIMGLPKPDTAARCLAWHKLDVPVDQRARTFDLTDGVGCENCNGLASAWLGPHTRRVGITTSRSNLECITRATSSSAARSASRVTSGPRRKRWTTN